MELEKHYMRGCSGKTDNIGKSRDIGKEIECYDKSGV